MDLIKAIIDVAKLEGEFLLRSGRISNTYFDKYQFEANPKVLRAIGEAMLPLIPNDITVLAGLEMGGIPVVTMLSQLSGLPAAFIRKQPKDYGTCKYAEGAGLSGRKVLLIEDVVSSGGAILDAASLMRADGIKVDRALCVIDRQSGGKERLAASGIELFSLFTWSDLLG